MLGFRVDANEHIATGHLMRCIAIAMQCMKLGEECLFLLAEDKETERLREKNIPYQILHSQWNNMESEMEQIRNIVEEEKLNWLIVDSYQVTPYYLEYLNQFVSVLYMDDLGKEKYQVDALVHYSQWEDDNYFQKKYDGEKTRLLVGMKYTPLRKEFSEDYIQIEREKRVLITTGGTDTYNVSGKLLEELQKREEFREYRFNVIVGSLNQNRQQLEEMAQINARIDLYQNVKNMSEFMRKSECAVSAGGTTLFELCATKTPTVCFSFAENQREFVNEMGKRQVMLCAGDATSNVQIEKIIADKLLMFVNDKNMRNEYANRMEQLVDGKGALRIAKFLCTEDSKSNIFRRNRNVYPIRQTIN